jgi:potassium channel subfamily K, other eukaryote
MARRLSFAIAQPITIIGWYVSGFLLIALVSVAGSNSSGFKLQPYAEHALTQAYYYGILASILYLIVGSVMVFTVVGAYLEKYKKEFYLTTAQRTLMLQTIIFMMYLLLGALVFKKVENWQYLDAVFWANFTLLTIGLGSPFAPATHLGRSLLFPYAIGGILTVGLVIGSVRSLVLERGKNKMAARFIEKKREKTVESVDWEKQTVKVSLFRKYHFSEEGLNEAQRREQEFNAMRKIQEAADWRSKYMALAFSTSAALILWFVGAAIYAICERPQGWTYFSALYFSYVSLLTIGYGDIQPASNSGKPFFLLWTLMAIPTLTIFISHLGDTVIKSLANLAIWAGNVTILPGESPVSHELKILIHGITQGHLLNPKELRMDKPPGFIPHEGEDEVKQDIQSQLREHAMDRLAHHLETEELDEALEADQTGDTRTRDIHLYHFVLVKELKSLFTDLTTNPNKHYSYRDWAWYLKLLGQDEGDESLHRRAPKLMGAEDDTRRELGKADGHKQKQWSWIGVRSPLMSIKTEPEWLVERLGTILELQMKKLRRGEELDNPPISIGDLLKRRKEEGRDDSKNEDKNGKDSKADKVLDTGLAEMKKDQ